MNGIHEAPMSEGALRVNPIIGIEKKCTKCNIVQPIEKFGRHKISKDGYNHWCNKCHYDKNVLWNSKNKDKVREYKRKWKKANKEKGAAYAKEAYQSDPERFREKQRTWRKRNPEKLKEQYRRAKERKPKKPIIENQAVLIEKKCSGCQKTKLLDQFSDYKNKKSAKCKECAKKVTDKWRVKNYKKLKIQVKLWKEKNKEKVEASSKKYKQNHPEKVKAARNKWHKENYNKRLEMKRKYNAKRNSTHKGRLNGNISSAISTALKGAKGGRHWETIVGFTIDELIKHIEKQFVDGMTWDNYGKNGWHIDHIIPMSVFNFEKPEDEDFKRCWSLKNLQPLWAKENCLKRDTLYKPFQPKLIFR